MKKKQKKHKPDGGYTIPFLVRRQMSLTIFDENHIAHADLPPISQEMNKIQFKISNIVLA